MKPKITNHFFEDSNTPRLSDLLNPRHELYILSELIDWKAFEEAFGILYSDENSRPPKPIRLMVGLLMLQHMFGLSDEKVVKRWIENPYWQFFCGFDVLQWKFPIHPSSMTRFRNRIGPEGMQKILSETIKMALDQKVVTIKDLKEVIADTTVMEKNIAYPTDARLYFRLTKRLVDLAKSHRINLRQSYTFVSKQALIDVNRYVHARQMKRAKKKIKQLKTYLRRVYSDLKRKICGEPSLKEAFEELFELTNRLLSQTRESKNKLYSLHAPEVECFSKGKVRKKYEFGCKVSLVVSHKIGLALSCRALHGNPYDGHTLKDALLDAQTLASTEIERVAVDKGYKGHGVTDKKVYISGQKKGVTASIKRFLKRRSAIEPHISHLKQEGKMGRNFLKGSMGDMINALLCGVGHNLRLIIRYLFPEALFAS
jgi:IS5 family transposase